MTIEDERELAARLHAEVADVRIDDALVRAAAARGRRQVRRRRAVEATGIVAGLAVVAGGLYLADPRDGRADDIATERNDEVLMMVERLPTPGEGQVEMLALARGLLAVDGQGCLVLEREDGTSWPIQWPSGWTAHRDESGVAVLLDRSGDIVAREGQGLEVGGGLGTPRDPGHPCAAASVWVAGPTIDLAPGTDPGEGGMDVTLSIIEPILAEHPQFDAGSPRWDRVTPAVVVHIADGGDPLGAEALKEELQQAVAGDDDAARLRFEPAVASQAELQALADQLMATRSDWARDPELVRRIDIEPISGSVSIEVTEPAVAPGLDGTVRELPSGAAVTIYVDVIPGPAEDAATADR